MNKTEWNGSVNRTETETENENGTKIVRGNENDKVSVKGNEIVSGMLTGNVNVIASEKKNAAHDLAVNQNLPEIRSEVAVPMTGGEVQITELCATQTRLMRLLRAAELAGQ